MIKKGSVQNKVKKEGPVTRNNTPANQGRTGGENFNGAIDPGSMTPERLFMMQQTLGNQAVSAMMQEPKEEVQKESSAPASTGSVSISAPALQFADNASSAAQTSSSPIEVKIPVAEGEKSGFKEGDKGKLPDVKVNFRTGRKDAIIPDVMYSMTMSQSGHPGAGNYGICNCEFFLLDSEYSVSGGFITVTGDFQNNIAYSVRPLSESKGKINISSPDDLAITQENYKTVVADLTPDMGFLNGRPRRNHFWSQDLVLKHEKFHAEEYRFFGELAFDVGCSWLALQTPSNETELKNYVDHFPWRALNYLNAVMAYPGVEERAYGSTVADYTALVNAIQAKGDRGDYKKSEDEAAEKSEKVESKKSEKGNTEKSEKP